MKSWDSHYVIPNIIQRALNLPVLTDEEIEAKMSRHRADFKLWFTKGRDKNLSLLFFVLINKIFKVGDFY